MSNIKVGYFALGPASTNCYIVYREDSKEAVVIDPANLGEKIFNELGKAGLQCVAMFLTHGHYDHIRGAKRLQQLSGAKIYCYESEKEVCESKDLNVSKLFREEYTMSPDELFKDNQEVTFAGITFKVLHTPGHTQGGCCYYVEEAKMLFSGDTIFMQSIARTDFEGGSESQLMHSIQDRILTLPDDTMILSGHGDVTTVGEEKANNPYIR